MTKAIIILSALLLSACVSNDQPSYVNEYKAITSQAHHQNIPKDAISNFVALFSDLDAVGLADKVNLVYADKLYFNDTLNTINDRKEMLAYLKHTAKNLDRYTFTLTDHAISGENLYLRWTMDIEFTAAGKDIQSQSIGMSHLKFDANGKVIVHQDYWDSVEAIYQHLPYVGYWIKKVRSKL